MIMILAASALAISSTFLWSNHPPKPSVEQINQSTLDILILSEQILWRVKTERSTDSVEQSLSALSMNSLVSGLTNDRSRKTFWINIYNAWYQILATREHMKRPEIFTKQMIPIAGKFFSLDDIEHGILRKYRSKYSLGYLPQLFPSKTIKQLAVSEIDFRIHFALNCGARSCPPIAFYTYHDIDQQLETATTSFLRSETEIDTKNKRVRVSKILQWFKGDFNGTSGIRTILSTYLPGDFHDYLISYKDYNWDAQLANFREAEK
ncbi:MAG: DUF547 domain-containing protein [Cytophagales bacterium]|nr:DUF547 domain-containing protein [Cytophagales bacterium]